MPILLRLIYTVKASSTVKAGGGRIEGLDYDRLILIAASTIVIGLLLRESEEDKEDKDLILGLDK